MISYCRYSSQLQFFEKMHGNKIEPMIDYMLQELMTQFGEFRTSDKNLTL